VTRHALLPDDVTGADVTGPDVTGPDVTGPDVTGPDVTGADVTGADVGGVDVVEALPLKVNFWLSPPWQSYSWICWPLAVPHTSRHLPDCALVMVPLELTFHCWLAPPLQL